MLVSGLNGGQVGGFSDIIRYLIPSIYLDMSYVCRVNVLHWPALRKFGHVCGHRGPILKDCPKLRKLDDASNPM